MYSIEYKDSELKEKIKKDAEKIFSKHPDEKYRRDPIDRIVKYPINNFIDFEVLEHEDSKSKIKLCTYLFLPDSKKFKVEDYRCVIYMLHGLSSHSNSFAHLAKSFSDIGCVVTAFDCRGHGMSEGKNGNIECWDTLISDSKKFFDETDAFLKGKFFDDKNPDSSKFLEKRIVCGMSMGGLLTYYVTKDEPDKYQAIYMAASFDITEPFHLKCIIRIIGTVCPNLILPSPCGESEKYKNPSNHEQKDPYQIRGRFRTAREIVNKVELSKKLLEKNPYTNNFIMIIPGVDKIVPPLSQFEFYEKAKSKDKEFVYYENCWHSIYAEEEMLDIEKKLCNWIEKRY